jgi:hypothetical protein
MADDHTTCTSCGDGLLPEDTRDGGVYGFGPLCPECYGLEIALRDATQQGAPRDPADHLECSSRCTDHGGHT